MVEDDALIGMALEATLQDAGFRVAGPFMKNTDALVWLKENDPDLAIVDVLLRDGPCTSVVHALQRRDIPFVIYSGLMPGNRPPELERVRWMEKPVSRDELTSVLWDLVHQAGAAQPALREPAELSPYL